MTVPPPAAEVLHPWRDFPVDRTPRPIVFLDSAVHIGGGGFIDGDAKLSWLAAAVETAVPLPEGVLELVTERRARRAAPTTLVVTDVEACEEDFWCDRGPRRLPAYRLAVTGVKQPVVVLDPTADCWWPEHSELGRPGGFHDHATVDNDDRTVHFPAFGGVLTLFHRAELIEYPTCVVGHAVTGEREVTPGTWVHAVGTTSMVTGHLNAPLAGRVLLHATGEPLAVLAATAGSV